MQNSEIERSEFNDDDIAVIDTMFDAFYECYMQRKAEMNMQGQVDDVATLVDTITSALLTYLVQKGYAVTTSSFDQAVFRIRSQFDTAH